MSIRLTVNGAPVEVVDESASLLAVLREQLGLTSVKDGCSPQGQCGCCTVLVDGGARVACVTPVRRVAGREVTTVFQDPMRSLDPTMTIGRMLSRYTGSAPASVAALDQVQIRQAAQVLRRYPHQLSGGMRQRVMIALALARAPRLLVADEPTTALDVSVQARLLDLLRVLVSDLGLAAIIVTHDLAVARLLTDRLMVMKDGRVVEQGLTDQVLDDPHHAYTQLLTSAVLSV